MTLKDEHSAILRELYSLDRLLGSLESCEVGSSGRILSSMSRKSIRLSERLSAHFQREEMAFYSVLEKRLGSEAEPVRTMRQEHNQLLDCFRALRVEILRMLQQGDSHRTWILASQLQDLRGRLSDHLSREERVLFWLAELRFSRLDRRKVSYNLRNVGKRNGASRSLSSASPVREILKNTSRHGANFTQRQEV